MKVGFRRVSPLRLAGVGGVAILALIGIGLHPPTGRFGNRVPSPPLIAGGVTVASIPVITSAVPSDRSSRGSTRRARPTTKPTRSQGGRQKTHRGSGKGAASAGPPSNNAPSNNGGTHGSGGGVPTVNCPSVEDHLPAIPAAAAAEVDQNLALLKQQIADANARLAQLAADPVDDPNFIQNTILGPLRDNRVATIDRIAIAIGNYTTRPTNLDGLAACTLNG